MFCVAVQEYLSALLEQLSHRLPLVSCSSSSVEADACHLLLLLSSPLSLTLLLPRSIPHVKLSVVLPSTKTASRGTRRRKQAEEDRGAERSKRSKRATRIKIPSIAASDLCCRAIALCGNCFFLAWRWTGTPASSASVGSRMAVR